MTLDLESVAKALIRAEEGAPAFGDLLEPGDVVTINVAGRQGPEGQPGIRGEQGSPGLDGDEGPTGPQGEKGDTGEKGPPGTDGTDGQDGKKGDRGQRGEKGTTGDRGPQGRDGPIGPQGIRGIRGPGGGGGGGSSGGGAPSGPAGGDLSGTYPNPSVVNDSHSHGPGTAPGSPGFDYIQDTDPGAVGAGKFWLFEGTFGYPDTYQLRRRNAANDGWLPVTAIYTETAEGVYINTPDNGSYLQLGRAGELTELAAADGTILFLSEGYFKLNSDASQGVTSGNVDPSAGAGVVGVRGSIYLRNDGISAGSLWVKSGDADTAWTLLGAGLSGSTQTYTESNVTTDRAYNANATSIDELADVLGTLIADLRARGVVA